MISNPYLPSPQKASAWAEGFIKGFIAQSSPEPSSEVGAEDIEAFNEGVQSGVEAQDNGLMFAPECAAASNSTEDTEALKHWFEGFDTAAEVIEGGAGLVGALSGLILPFCLFLITAPVGTLPPEQVLPTLAQPLVDDLAAMGVGSVELYCAVGIDPTAHDCEFRLSPLFLKIDQAQSAAQAMGRQRWIIVSWRTDQCGSFKIEGSSG